MLDDTVTDNCHAGTSNVSSKGIDQARPDQIVNPSTTEGHFAKPNGRFETTPNTNAEAATRPSQQTQERTRTAQQRVLARTGLIDNSVEKRGNESRVAEPTMAKLCVSGIQSHNPASLENFLEI
jgi:hypothetical protein